MSMNVASMNNMAVKSAMVGFLPTTQMKEVKKEEQQSTTVQEMEEEDTSNDTPKTAQDSHESQEAENARVQQSPQRVQQRRISDSTIQGKSTRSETREAKPKAETGQTEQGTAGQEKPRVALDNTARLSYEFKARQQEAGRTGTEGPASPEAQKRQFLTRLRGMVNTQYQQYLKSDDNLYTRRNLREIMTALNQDDPNINSQKKKADDREQVHGDEIPGELEGFNKFNQMRAARSLKLLHQYQQEPPKDQLSLVA